MMNEKEKAALRKNHLCLVEDLDPRDVADYMYQQYMIEAEQYEEICKPASARNPLCKSFLSMLTKPGSKCTFKGFVEALRYKNTYDFLADKLERSLSIEEMLDKESEEETVVKEADETGQAIIFEPIRKIDVFTKSRHKMARIAHELKRLSHDGETEKFNKLTGLIHQNFSKSKLNLNKPALDKMELADMKFTALEAEASAKRLKYDVSLCGSEVFTEMASVIPFTSNPRVTSMTYLARFGSSIGMSEGTDSGLGYLQYAKQHAEYVTPCKDTGMVYYIEVNLLSQKYEASPTDDLKLNVLKTAQLAMSQFESENEDVRTDYQRMLMLKMVYCYLGIGLFGKRIKNVIATSDDKEAAKNCLDFIEKPEVWNGMEKRRKMLFLLAKSEYHRQMGASDLAKMHAKESKKIARRNGWTAELPNIEALVKELEDGRASAGNFSPVDDFVQNLIDDLTGNKEITDTESHSVRNTEYEDNCRMQTLKVLSSEHPTYSQNDELSGMRLLEDMADSDTDTRRMNFLKQNDASEVDLSVVNASHCSECSLPPSKETKIKCSLEMTNLKDIQEVTNVQSTQIVRNHQLTCTGIHTTPSSTCKSNCQFSTAHSINESEKIDKENGTQQCQMNYLKDTNESHTSLCLMNTLKEIHEPAYGDFRVFVNDRKQSANIEINDDDASIMPMTSYFGGSSERSNTLTNVSMEPEDDQLDLTVGLSITDDEEYTHRKTRKRKIDDIDF